MRHPAATGIRSVFAAVLLAAAPPLAASEGASLESAPPDLLRSAPQACAQPAKPTIAASVASARIGQSFDLSWTAEPNGSIPVTYQIGYYYNGMGPTMIAQTTTGTSIGMSITTGSVGDVFAYFVRARDSSCALTTDSDSVSVTVASSTAPPACTADATTLCLYGGRFKVQASYRDYANNTGTAKAVTLTTDSGYFWFFTSANVELVAKVVSFCSGSGGNYGLYVSGLTDVSVTFTVTDTKTSTTRSYPNALGNRFCTIGDGWNVCP